MSPATLHSLAPAQPHIVIIGGGFTGACVAYHLARALPPDRARITVIEPRASLGQGLAYSTSDPVHRTNVPASRITMDCACSGQFADWLAASPAPLTGGADLHAGAIFAQRSLVGRYVAESLAPFVAAGRIRHLATKASAVTPVGPRYRITLAEGPALLADQLVIATSHPPPAVPPELDGVKDAPQLVCDPSDAARISQVAKAGGNVLVIGSGLTSADVIASLDAKGFAGKITCLSRRGLRSRGHAFGFAPTEARFAEQPETTALGLLRRIRRAVRADADAGLPWQAALDRVRIDGPAIWAALPLAERQKLVRKLRIWWDVHRFRIAPQIEAVLDRRIAEGSLTMLAARLDHAEARADGIHIGWRTRRRKGSKPHHDGATFDAVIVTTGPAHGGILDASPVLRDLADAGLVRCDALKLGLDVANVAQAVGLGGKPSAGLYVAGPLARGHIGELMGIPEVTAHAEATAAMVLAAIGQKRDGRTGALDRQLDCSA